MADLNGTGALTGAASGAAAGAAFGPWGAAIGGVAGGLIGLFSSPGPKPADIKDPVTGQQITDAAGNVIASQQQMSAFLNGLQGQNGIQNQSQVYQQLQDVAAGKGPNPAQAQLAQATGANVAAQGALMAGQRGTNSNVGLASRQIAQQGAATQQQAAGQAATLQANQSLNALGQAGGIAGQQVNEQQNALNALNATTLQNQGQLLGAAADFNKTKVSNDNGAIAQGQQANTYNTLGGLAQGAGAVATAFGAGGTNMGSAPSGGAPSNSSGPSLGVNTTFDTPKFASGGPVSFAGRHLFAKGGRVNVLVSPGERYLSPTEVTKVAEGKKSPMKAGEHIPGEAKVKGAKDSYANDTVSKTLQSGGIVLPRHVTQAKDAPEKAAAFVRAIMAKQGLKK